MKGQSEKEIQNQIITMLRHLGVYCWRNNSVGVYDAIRKCYRKPMGNNHLRGVSDILGVLSGRFLAIEVKSEKGRLSPEQKIFLENINKQGGVGFVARSLKDVAVNLSRFFPDHEGLKRMAGQFCEKEPLSKH